MKFKKLSIIEMILCVMITGMLCSLIFVAMGPAREAARHQICTGNLHEWGKSFSLYIQDYGGIDPIDNKPLTHAQLGLPVDVQGFVEASHLQKFVRCPDTHFPSGDKRYYVSYLAQYLVSDDNMADYQKYVSKRGSDLPLLICTMHNVDTDFNNQPSWATGWFQILRINQQVQFEQKNVHNSYLDF